MVGDNIKKLREERDMKLNETARLAGISGSYLSNIERGIKSNPSTKTIAKVSKALNVEDELLLKAEMIIGYETLSV